MDPIVIFLVIAVCGFSIVHKLSDTCGTFDVFSGRIFDTRHSAEHINFEFNGIFHVLLGSVVLVFLIFVVSAFSELGEPSRVFVPIDHSHSHTPSHSHSHTAIHHHSHKSVVAAKHKVAAHHVVHPKVSK